MLVNFLLVNIRLVNYILVNFLLVNIGECQISSMFERIQKGVIWTLSKYSSNLPARMVPKASL